MFDQDAKKAKKTTFFAIKPKNISLPWTHLHRAADTGAKMKDIARDRGVSQPKIIKTLHKHNWRLVTLNFVPLNFLFLFLKYMFGIREWSLAIPFRIMYSKSRLELWIVMMYCTVYIYPQLW